MPGVYSPSLAMLSVPQAFGMDALHTVMQQQWAQARSMPVTPVEWLRGMSRGNGLGIPPSRAIPGPGADADPAEWMRQMSMAGGLGIAPSKSTEGTEADPETWLGDMAHKGLPGTENSDRYLPPGTTQADQDAIQNENHYYQVTLAPGAQGDY